MMCYKYFAQSYLRMERTGVIQREMQTRERMLLRSCLLLDPTQAEKNKLGLAL